MPDSIPATIGKYPIERILGKGAMGIVYLGRHEQLRRPVAIKMMLPKAARNPSAHARFLREARALATIRSNHVISVYDVDEHEGRPYFVMEYVEGLPLDDFLSQFQPLELKTILDLCIDFAQGLADAHGMGVIHRDLKPANLFVETKNNRGKLLDFGLTQISENTKLTNDGTVMGTPSYMPLEQAEGKPADHRSDIYSMGVVFYEIATGQLPVQGETLPQIIYSLMNRDPIRIETLNPTLPKAFADLVHRMLQRERENRPQSMDEALEVLRGLRGARSVSQMELPPLAPQTTASVPAAPISNRPVGESAFIFESETLPRRENRVVATQQPLPKAADLFRDTESRDEPRGGEPPEAAETEETRSDWSRSKSIWGGVAFLVLLLVGGVVVFRGSSADPDKEKRIELAQEPERKKELDRIRQENEDKLAADKKRSQAEIERLKKDKDDEARLRLEAESKVKEQPKEVAKIEPKVPLKPKLDEPIIPKVVTKQNPSPKKEPASLDCTGPNGATPTAVQQAQKEWAVHLGVEVETSIDLGGGVKMDFVLIPPGKFMMGSKDSGEQAIHPVTLTKPFYLAKYEMTQEEYVQLMGVANPSRFKDEPNSKRHPVETVTWQSCKAAWEKLATKNLPKGFNRASLPTEAQWEYACRAGTRTKFSVGDELQASDANFRGTKTMPVGGYKANALGLFDMHGNVCEWCLDGFVENAYRAEGRTDPEVAPQSHDIRCLRGGAWNDFSQSWGSSDRGRVWTEFADVGRGFRLALLPVD